MSKEALLQKLVAAGVQFNKYAEPLFEHPLFVPCEKPETVTLVKLSFSDLEVKVPCSYESILESGQKMGLKLCPLYLGAFLRLEMMDLPEGPYLAIASPRSEADENFPAGFYIRNLESVQWLRGYRVDGEPEWPPHHEFIFVKPD